MSASAPPTMPEGASNPPTVESAPRFRFAWQPFTPAGLARFADASFANLVLVQFVVAALATAVVCWFAATIWFPAIREATRNLPDTGQIRNGELQSPASSSPLVENRFIGCLIDVHAVGHSTLASDVRVQFHRYDVSVCSLFGCMSWEYPRNYIIELNRPEAEPWWGAWEPIALGMIAIAVPLLLFACWCVLATLYSPVAWLIAFYADRRLTWAGSWRLASAALMPGAVLLTFAILGYGLKGVDVVRVLIRAGAHIIVGWVYVAMTPFWLPRLPENARKNPFAGGP